MKLIGLMGPARSGKTSSANYIVGRVMLSVGLIDDFYIEEDGKLFVKANFIQDDGSIETRFVEFKNKNENRDPEFDAWAKSPSGVWQYARIFSLADPLKYSCIDVLGLDHDQAFGDKTGTTDITFGDVKFFTGDLGKKDTDFLTVRECLEFVGTLLFKRVKPNCFIEATLRQIRGAQYQTCIIDDVRTLEECEAIQKAGGVVIRLERGSPTAASEVNMNEAKPDFRIDNRGMTLEQKTQALEEILVQL